MKFIIIFTPFLLLSCVHVIKPTKAEKIMADKYSPSWPHGVIRQIFDDIFFVTGTNIITHEGLRIQSSRDMIIIRENKNLTLINTVRLDEKGLKELEKLGAIKNIIRIGAFHGRDDAFYKDRYNAKLWAFSTMDFDHNEEVDFDLKDQKLPITNSEIFAFKSTLKPEALILIKKEGGILVSCDSIKNWQKKDEFFDDNTYLMMEKAESIGEAKIDSTWLSAMKPAKSEIRKIADLEFEHLLSAHGEPLIKNAKTAVVRSIQQVTAQLN